MQPSSDHDSEPTQRSALRRYGPLGAVLTVLLLIVGASVVLSGGKDDDKSDTATDETTDAASDGEYPDGVVTWSMAEDDGIEADFPDTCDTESGMVAIPFFFRTECVANVEDNGGATADGVTGDEIKIVLWLPNESDPLFSIIRTGLGFDDTPEQMRETQQGLAEVFQRYYQTYGRTVKIEFLEASGSALDPVSARADAVKAAEMKPFAVLGGPLLASTWTEELHARGIVCMLCPGINGPEPTSFGITPMQDQVTEHVVNYVSAKLVGKKAEFAGEDLRDKERVFGYLHLGQNDNDEDNARDAVAALKDKGADVPEMIVYPLDPGGIQEHATNAITRMKEAGVTTVIVRADPITLPAMTEEATKQDFFPEWVLAGFPFTDTSAFGRSMDQAQWAHAFGISYLPPASRPEIVPAYKLYEWYHGTPPPADESLLLTYPQVVLFFTGVQFAGPNLTTETFQQAMFAWPPTPRALTQPSVDYGTKIWGEAEYGGIDDMVELWWDAEAEGEDETGKQGTGLYRYVDGGKRYYVDEWTDDLRVFDPEGAITEITDPPDEEVPPDYPPPR